MDSATNPQPQPSSFSKNYLLIGFLAVVLVIVVAAAAFFIARFAAGGNSPAPQNFDGGDQTSATSSGNTRQSASGNGSVFQLVGQLFNQGGQDPTRKPVFNTPQQVTLPIGVDDPDAVSVGFVYKFDTQLTELKTENSRTRLITTVKNPNAWFTITPDTEIVFRSADGHIKPATVEDLKPGQNLEIFTVYGLKSNLWLMQRVFILEGGQPGENL